MQAAGEDTGSEQKRSKTFRKLLRWQNPGEKKGRDCGCKKAQAASAGSDNTRCQCPGWYPAVSAELGSTGPFGADAIGADLSGPLLPATKLSQELIAVEGIHCTVYGKATRRRTKLLKVWRQQLQDSVAEQDRHSTFRRVVGPSVYLAINRYDIQRPNGHGNE